MLSVQNFFDAARTPGLQWNDLSRFTAMESRMGEELPFAELLRRVRAGDQEAAAELVRLYEPTVRRVVRFRLQGRSVAAADSMDICQSVLASFFFRAAAGQYDIEQPEHLVQLLARMARNKLASQTRKDLAQRRDRRRLLGGGEIAADVAGAAPTPSRQLMARELLAQAYERMTPEERDLVQRRNDDQAWDDIAAELGETAQNLRKRLSRALNRVARELGLDEEADD
jgi:RNA polymerase sigma factor (sigma-70 family)